MFPQHSSLPADEVCARPAGAAERLEAGFYPAQTSWPEEPAYRPTAEGWIDMEGAKLCYQDGGGTGVPIVLLRASTGSAGSWPYQQDRVSKEGYRVITYSRGGHHRSTRGSAAKQVTGAADLFHRHAHVCPHMIKIGRGCFHASETADLRRLSCRLSFRPEGQHSRRSPGGNWRPGVSEHGKGHGVMGQRSAS